LLTFSCRCIFQELLHEGLLIHLDHPAAQWLAAWLPGSVAVDVRSLQTLLIGMTSSRHGLSTQELVDG
jgi:hypothetical protein